MKSSIHSYLRLNRADSSLFICPNRIVKAPRRNNASTSAQSVQSARDEFAAQPYKSLKSKPNADRNTSDRLPGLFKRRTAQDYTNSIHKGHNLRPHREDGAPFLDESYIRSNFPLPTEKEYPAAPSGLFTQEAPNVLMNVSSHALTLENDFYRTSYGFRHIVHGRLSDGQEMVAEGHGKSRKSARAAALLHLISKLHQSGVLKQWYKPEEALLGEKELQVERSAKIDIYNYAARFLLIPEISSKSGTSLSRRKGRKVRRREVTVELKEQGLRATASATEHNVAEINACFRLKQKIEKYHAKHGDESIVIKDSETLNTVNAKTFIDFYKLKHRGSAFTIKTDFPELEKLDSAFNCTQVLLDGESLGPVVSMPTRKAAEELSYLVAAITLCERTPELQKEFQSALSASGEILAPLKPVDMTISRNCLSIMKDTLQEARQVGLPHTWENLESEEVDEAVNRVIQRRRLSSSDSASRSEQLLRRQEAFKTDPAVKEVREKKESLPMSQHRAKVLNHIEDHPYSVIIGTTGSGKTTQVPQILLEDAISKNEGAQCNIICTQPRRIAAMSVSQRVAAERNEQLQDTVGYHVRFNSRLPRPGGSITYCTTGILLQQLQRNPDQVLDGISHIIIDEVHERDIFIDFLLTIVKKAIQIRRKDGKSTPKVILMSATIDSELFSKYFEEVGPDGQMLQCPSLSIPGRTFPVVEKHLETILDEIKETHGAHIIPKMTLDEETRDFLQAEESLQVSTDSMTDNQEENQEVTIDWKGQRVVTAEGVVANEQEDALVPIPLIATTIAHIAKTSDEGAILVFHPGYDEIKSVLEVLQKESPLGINFKDEQRFKISILHSTIPAAQQQEVFEPVPKGCRKIILSTNIAETSVTIPDVQYVVDSGKLREKRYDQVRRITKLQCTWISKSNAKQRAGRAGRVQNGTYYALYGAKRAHALRAIGLPEMLRSDLQEVCLDIKAQSFKMPIREFLSEMIEPPAPSAVEASVTRLQDIQALTSDEKLTSLGRLLASLPVHPSLGKMIVLGVIFRCLDPMIILGACFNERSLFIAPPEQRKQAREKHGAFLQGSESDHIAALNAFRTLRTIRCQSGHSAMTRFAIENFLHIGAFNNISQTYLQIEEILAETGLIPPTISQDRQSAESRGGGQVSHAALNVNSDKISLIKGLILAGTHPNLAVSKGSTFRTPDQAKAMLHPSSLNYTRGSSRQQPDGAANDYATPMPMYTYSSMSKAQDGRSLLKDTTICTPLMAFLFGGQLESQPGRIRMDDWLQFSFKEAPLPRPTSSSLSSSPYAGESRLADMLARGGIAEMRQTLLKFRQALDTLLVGAFRDLGQLRASAAKPRSSSSSSLSSKNKKLGLGRGRGLLDKSDDDGEEEENGLVGNAGGQTKSYLADNEMRIVFTSGLVEALDS